MDTENYITGNDITGFAVIETTFNVYIDPSYDGSNGPSDGSINRPYTSWSNFTIIDGGAYFQKRGTVANLNSITYASNNIIGAYGIGSRPILNSTTSSYTITGDNQENVLIENLEIVNNPYINGTRRGTAIRFLHNFKNMYVNNCSIHGGGQAISASYGGSEYYPYNLTITNNEMYDLSTDAVYAQGILGYVNFSGNYIHNINMAWFEVGQDESQSPGDGLQLISHQYGQVEIFAGNNIIDRTNTANKFCIILVGNYTGILENNTCYVNSYLTVESRVSGFYLSPTENQLIFKYNKCFNCSYGVYNYVRNLTMHNNLFVNSNTAINTMGGDTVYGRVYMYNNLFYNSVNRDVSSWNSNVTLYNNIFYSDILTHTEFSGTQNFVASDYNLFNTPFSTGLDANSILDDPLFNNPASYDFSLHEGSPAIDAGIDVGLVRDIIGTLIPQGSAPDIGAYEYYREFSATGNLTVNAGIGGSASGNASNFIVPATINIVGIASIGYNFSNWTLIRGDCIIENVLNDSTSVTINSGECFVQANFVIQSGLSGYSNTIYIDPNYNIANGPSDGTYEHPFVAWSEINLQSNMRYLQKRGTTYTSSSKILLYHINNVTVGDYGSGEKPIFNYTGSQHNYSFQFDQCTDCALENMRITAPSSTGLIALIGMGSNTGGVAGGTRINITGCEVWKAGSDSSRAMGIRGGGNNIKILNTTIHDISIDGIYVNNAIDIEIGYSNVYDINRRYFINSNQDDSSGDGIQLDGNWDGFYIHHTTINRTNGAGNKFNLILNSGGSSQFAEGILEHNTFINDATVTSAVHIEHGDGIITRYNTFMGSTQGIRLGGAGTSNNLIHGNLFYNGVRGIGVGYIYSSDVSPIGPTIGTKVYNNIFYNISGYHVWVDKSFVEVRNNIHLRAGDSGVALYNFGSGSWNISNNCYGDIATAGIPGIGTNPVIGNPLFVDVTNKNFHLQNISPCIDAGFDVGILFDRDGVNIPQNSVPDIGAYEHIFGAYSTGNLIVNAGIGGSASGNASNFIVPAIRSINAIASSGYIFNNWTKIIGDCIINNIENISTTVSVNSGDCIIQANFIYIGGTVSNGGICTTNINCSSGNCDADFSGVMRCHANANSCVINSTGTEILSALGRCTNQYQYKTCNNGLWGSILNVTTGYVCSSGVSVIASENTNCGNGTQNCYCANDWKQCDLVNDCTHDIHIVGFNSTGGCDSTNSIEKLSNIANSNNYICRGNTNATLCVGMCSSLFNVSPCNGSSFYCSLGICENSQVNHPPVIENQSFSVPENSQEGEFIGTIIATDVDEGQIISYSILSGNNDDAFRLEEYTGKLYVNEEVLDFESEFDEYNLIVLVEDNYSIPANDSATINIQVSDVREGSSGGGGGSRSSSSYIPRVEVNSTNITYANGVWSFSEIIAEKEIELYVNELDLGLTYIKFEPSNTIESVIISIDDDVQEKELIPENFNSLHYFKINSNKLNNSNIALSELRFKVSRNLKENEQDIQMEDIVLLKLNNQKWEEINLSLRDLDKDNYYLNSQTQMYGSFALGLKMKLVDKELTSPTLLLENEEQQEISAKTSDLENKFISNGILIGVLIMVISLITTVSILGVRKNKGNNNMGKNKADNNISDNVINDTSNNVGNNNHSQINKVEFNNNLNKGNDLINKKVDLNNYYYREIMNYIEERLRKGESLESLRPKLINVGWLASDVDEMLNYFKNKRNLKK